MRLFVLLTVFAFAGCNRSDANKPIEVGHIDAAEADDASFKALELAVEELNKDPAKRPLGHTVVIRHAPAGTTPEEAGAQAVRFVALNKVRLLIGGDRSDSAHRIGDALSGELVFGLSVADWPGVPVSPNLFTVGIAPAERGRALAKAALANKPAAVVIVRDRPALAANLAADAFVVECKLAGTHVIESDLTPTRPTADVVFFACSTRKALEARHAADKACVFGGSDAELPTLYAGGAPAEGFFIATAFHADSGIEAQAGFVNHYREKFGQAPSAVAALAYDAFHVWAEAVRRANSLDAGPLREHLLNRNNPFDTVTGPITFADDQTARRKVFVGRLLDGKLTNLTSIDSSPTKQP
jgi:ABC-type branched-subunit amino acid transport system substrate-binding protein